MVKSPELSNVTDRATVNASQRKSRGGGQSKMFCTGSRRREGKKEGKEDKQG